MKRLIVILSVLLLAAGSANAQSILRNIGERAKKAVEEKVGEKVEQAVGSAIDKATSKKDKKGEVAKEESAAPEVAAPVEAAEPAPAAAPQTKSATINWNNYDFVAGDEIIFEDTQENEKLGEFPSMWDAFSGAAEIVEFDGQKCINTQDATITPLMKDNKVYLTDECTIEFDVYIWSEEEFNRLNPNTGLGLNGYEVRISSGDQISNIGSGSDQTSLAFYFDAAHTTEHERMVFSYKWYIGDNMREGQYELKSVKRNAWHHIAISFNKRAYKVYFDEQRVVNIPNAQVPKYIIMHGSYDYEHLYFWKNIRIAKGAVPLYDRLASEGKIVTYAITFDTGKATIKPESTGEINRITKIMQDNPTIKFEVQGHCDNTGSDAVNDPLSQKRAEAIVAALVGNGIAKDRLTAVGKGSHVPIADNNTDEGRAKNRRVEFVKQ
ncbi:MAG: OmpA family protein [Bacteroidales bacterium]|nr:OmpA family protein [Bacteroidales bacterium]